MSASISLTVNINSLTNEKKRIAIDDTKYADLEISVTQMKPGGLCERLIQAKELPVDVDGLAYIEFAIASGNKTYRYSVKATLGKQYLITVRLIFIYKCQYCGQFYQRLDDGVYCANCIEDIYQR
ncbi:MAG: hypothetical protein LBM18_02835 [Oscillospiraceae bacterium]|jgi:hypothetical protein|nr:hypothetical protein [Oscillospiraceae bacterium]